MSEPSDQNEATGGEDERAGASADTGGARDARSRGSRPTHPEHPCLNCGDPTTGEYCPTCGQRKVDARVSVRAMFMDLLEDQFIVGHRLPNTLKGLLLHPGLLTAEHLNGRIARYIAPFRLYLASSLLFFLLLSITSLQMLERANFGEGRDRVPGAQMDSLALARLDSLLADTLLPAGVRPSLAIGRDTVLNRLSRADSLVASRRAERTNWAEGAEVRTGMAAVDSLLMARIRTLGTMEVDEAVRTVAREFFGWVPTVMFVLLPVFALVLKALYIRRRRYYAEHFVFLLHAHSFVFLMFSALLLLRELGALNEWVVMGLLGWTVVYIYLAMRRVYGQGWFKTFVKYWILGWMYVWILTFTIPVAIIGTLLLL